MPASKKGYIDIDAGANIMAEWHLYKSELLWCGLLAVMPLLSYGVKQFNFPGLQDWPKDLLSDNLSWLVRALAATTVIALTIAAAAPFTEGGTETKIGNGAEIVMVLDRSGSMSENLVRQDPLIQKKSTTRIQASRDVLLKFLDQRQADTFGLVAFNASAIAVAPLSSDRELARAALKSAESYSSGNTALSQALEVGLNYFKDRPLTATRVLLLVSDGDAKIKTEEKDVLQQLFHQYQVQLMWIYVQDDDDHFLDVADLSRMDGAIDTDVALHQSFQSLGVPYSAFEVSSKPGLQRAIAEISRMTNQSTRYEFRLPRQDFASYFYWLALILLCLLFWLKQHEITQWVSK
ncbi:MAG: VWA domain-containing protein [Gammaproteobacteria bacterium]|nr:VWA domain-containing protein [Gammaproteobacteria bacterium]